MRFYSPREANFFYFLPPREIFHKDHTGRERQEVNPGVVISFKAGMCKPADLRRMDRKFRDLNPTNPYGSVPYGEAAILGAEFTDNIFEDIAIQGWDAFSRISMFDTERDIQDIDYVNGAEIYGQPDSPAFREKMRADVETFLLEHQLRGVEILLDEDAPSVKPWPNYPAGTCNGGQIQQVLATVKAMGIDPLIVLSFEQEHENRKGLVAALQAVVDESQAEVAELDSLSLPTPTAVV